ncbi:pilus assembly protein [Siccirubricoccus sp. KC 17139]|uniref:Pilus assembly protein n=1 Tax=Siccirubricoccus soli TaxID=2899147 RepID=A0ABT1DE30_9PROT|nr:TadE/TadG family type IV pilus assembly protein [Siccirubricoccus soli]MCO6419235.1 pilus assembly protein [Siccirubricoccus soli]MCP2685370.1 pilus assembly protein [Siccirubricoccus soli]
MLRKVGRKGASAVELALVAPVLLLLLAGTFDLANVIQLSMRLERATRTGAQYAMANPSDATAIRNAVIQAWPELTPGEVVVTCACGIAAAACGTACSAGVPRTVTVTAERSLTPLLLQEYSKGTGHAVLRLR